MQLGDITLDTPVMLAPMAGVTNPPFRQICREFGEAAAHEVGLDLPPRGEQRAPSALYVCEMITSRALVERSPETIMMVQPDVGDPVRSIQLYGVEPAIVGRAVEILINEDWADHIDLNFGCPVPKVTRKGGGSALPWKHDLFGRLVDAAVTAAEKASRNRDHEIPVTAKVRIGIDAEHETFHDAARIADAAGIKALTLHARTMAQHYSGSAQWERIAELKAATTLPVFGNGDVFEAEDALRLRAETQADGVVVGRGCQGRPWLFYDLVAAYHGSDLRARPNLRQVVGIILRHAKLSIDHFGGELRAMREMRKHTAWYLRGFSVGGEARHKLGLVETLTELEARLHDLDLDQEYPAAAEGKRGRAGAPKKPHLPEFWLESHELNEQQLARIHEAELGISGG